MLANVLTPLTEGASILDALNEILVPLVAVGLAEMGDKTQLSILLLSSRTKKYIQLLAGIMLAFLLADGFAILVGSWVTSVVPVHLVKLISGAVFILFGILILKGDGAEKEGGGELSSKNAFVSGFSMIFLSEWGDKTQIASALFAAEYDPRAVFVGVMTALAFLSIMAVYLGRFLSDRIDRGLIMKIAGAAFIVIGLSFVLSFMYPFAFSLTLSFMLPAAASSAFADIV